MIVITTDGLQADAATVLHVVGDVDTLAADDLREQLRRAAPGADGAVVVDLSAVTFMSCAALRVLAEAQARLGPRMRLGARARIVARLLEITGLTSLFDTAPTAEPVPDAPHAVVGGPPGGGGAGTGSWTFSRTDLERVRGLLMGVHGCDAEEAWQMLTRAAAGYGVPVGELVDLLVGGRRNSGRAPSSVSAVAALTVLMRMPAPAVAGEGEQEGSDVTTGPTRAVLRLAGT